MFGLKFKFPIALKLVLMTLGIVLLVMIPVAQKTTSQFIKVSGTRERDSNRSQVDARANELNVVLQDFIDKSTLLGTLLVKAKTGDGETKKESVAFQFQRALNFVSLNVYAIDNSGKPTLVDELVNEDFLRGFKLNKSYINDLFKKRPFPLSTVFAGTPMIRTTMTSKDAPAFLSLGIPLIKKAAGQISHIAVTNIKYSVIQKSFAQQGERTLYLVDRFGTVLAHPDEQLVISSTNLKNNGVVKKAIASEFKQGDLRYKSGQDFFIAAYSRALFDIAVISEASESIILEPAREVRRTVMFYTMLAMSLSILIITAFSLVFTRPISKLVYFTREIAKGNFSFSAHAVIKSNDEMGTLAFAFDQMTSGLQERDKIKTLFGKFHGSSVTQSLLTSGEIRLGGSKTKAVIFFSDIRGFTSYSEKRSPEKVVENLNKYFSAMVEIILRNHGIVDKFIGDAIMAVWGAPQSSGRDSHYAVKAALEMREALVVLNNDFIKAGEEPLRIGMGLHEGEVISGTIGSKDRMEFTVMGDAANTSSRIESVTKAFGTDLLISETLMRSVRSEFIVEQAGDVEAKGKSEALKLYFVHGYRSEKGEEVIIKTPYSHYQAENSDKAKVKS